ncbi:MAG: protoporphyrinogen oxidase [Caldilineaceae bacterium]
MTSSVETNELPVVIVGGGIAGLSTAYYLQKAGVPYVLLEQGDRWGGKIFSEHVTVPDGSTFVVEGGPDSFITQKPWGAALARELGLSAHMLGTNERQRQTYVLHKGKPKALPDGVLMIVPTKFKPFVFSTLISPWGKLRMGMDLFIPPRRDGEDETLADFVRRRLGSECLDKIAEPLMSGIYNAEADKQSLLATFPRFRELEAQHGSVTKGMLASQRARKAAVQGTATQAAPGAPGNNGGPKSNAGAAAPNEAPSQAPGKPLSAFVSFQDGIEELVTVLVSHLTGDLRLHAAVTGIEQAGTGYTVRLANGEQIAARAVVLATPAFVSADIVRPLAPGAADLLAAIRYVSTGTISFGFRASEAPNPLNGYGLVVPASAKRPINAITLSSVKFEQRAPEGYILLRAFFGGSRSPQSMDLDDETLIATVRGELAQFLGIRAEPLFHRIYRWRRSNPQYDVGHLERIAQIEAALPPGVYVTGSAYRGVGIPDCIKQGQDTAGKIQGR